MPVDPRLLALIELFQKAGLQAVVSTNGRLPDADIEVTKVPANQAKTKDERDLLTDVQLTAHGKARLGT